MTCKHLQFEIRSLYYYTHITFISRVKDIIQIDSNFTDCKSVVYKLQGNQWEYKYQINYGSYKHWHC